MSSIGSFPERRPRRLRRTPALRRLVAETEISVNDLIAPLFVKEAIGQPNPVSSMPGVVQHTLESLVKATSELVTLGVPAVVLFGIPAHRDATGSGATDPNGIVPLALRAVRDEVGDSLVLITDCCLDEYTDHGHCGLLDASGRVANDATLERYSEMATCHAAAGADLVAPSGMMDGQVRAIRSSLDAESYPDVGILAYAAKFASSFYGPFRDAVDVEIAGGGDRRSYQEDPANGREALVEVALDVAEGADMVMVKPALPYLDVISEVRRRVDVPVAAYQVSGEYAMVKAAAGNGWLDEPAVALESLVAIKRAGAGSILTYFARDIARELGR